jgi:hypothetical protein
MYESLKKLGLHAAQQRGVNHHTVNHQMFDQKVDSKEVRTMQIGVDSFGAIISDPATGLSAPTVILAAAAARTKNIRLSSAVTVLSTADPCIPGIRHAGSDLTWSSRDRRRAGFIHRSISIVWFRFG